MKRIIFFTLIPLIFACAKDPLEVTTDEIFDIDINGLILEDVDFIADNNTRYQFELTAKSDIDIDNGKDISISVSDGKLFSLDNLGSESGDNSINGTVQGEKFSFYFEAGTKAVESVVLSITVGNAKQSIQFPIQIQEPDELILSVDNSFPSPGSNVDITAFLVCNDPTKQPSEKLKIDFHAFKASLADSINIALDSPNFVYSTIFDDVTKAKIKLQSDTNPGSVYLIGTYKKSNSVLLSDTILLNFN